jgi:integral membrane protein
MQKVFKSPLVRLGIIGYLEGISLLCLVFIAVPLKYAIHQPAMVKAIGPVHGALFLWYVFTALSVGIEQGWKFTETTWKVLMACIVPFGTFYIDRHILRAHKGETQA